jgi:adenylate cyclase
MTNLERDLTDSIRDTLARAGQRNELRVAWIRAISLSIVVVVGGQFMEITTIAMALGWMLSAWAIVAVERRTAYRRWVPSLTTALDAAMIASFTLRVERGQALALATTALVCTLLAITGAIRIRRFWVWVTTSLSIANTALAAYTAGLGFFEGLLLCLLIVMAGMLGAWLSRISRNAIESEVQRVVAGRFVPAQVLDAGYRAPLKQLTEARALDATVLISDIRSFTTLAETLPPADVLEFLNRVQGTFASIVQEHGGSVDKFMGDGMLAVFGVPNAIDDHAARGIAAAQAIARAAREIGVPIGIGVHSGRVVAGILGSGSRLELTVIGDTVNIASRLESLTKEKQVTALISDSVVDRAGIESSSLLRLGPARLRGRSQELVIYTLAA